MAPQKNHGLDLMRGLAACGVGAYHYLSWNLSITMHSLGTFGVYLFFSLSAVTMMMRYEGDFRDAIFPDRLISFYRNRVARLIPLLALVSVLSAHWALGQGDRFLDQAARTLLTATGAMALHLPGFISNATGAWSLGIEAVFYVVFPIVALLATRASTLQLALATAALVVLQQVTIALIVDMPAEQFWNYYITAIIFAPFFSIGVLIFKLPMPIRTWNFWVALISLAAMAGYTQIFQVILWEHPLHYLVVTTICGAAVAFSYRSEVPRVLVGCATFLGDISYSLYLTHWFAHRLAASAVRDYGAPAALQPAIFAASALAIAWLSFRFFERPMRDILRSKRVGRETHRSA